MKGSQGHSATSRNLWYLSLVILVHTSTIYLVAYQLLQLAQLSFLPQTGMGSLTYEIHSLPGICCACYWVTGADCSSLRANHAVGSLRSAGITWGSAVVMNHQDVLPLSGYLGTSRGLIVGDETLRLNPFDHTY